MTNTTSTHSTLLSTTRVPDHVASIAKSPGGKHDLSRKMPAMAPLKVEEFRECFAGSAASLFAMIRAGRCERAWLNDIDPAIANYWTVVQQQPAALMREIIRMHEQYGIGSQEMFDTACAMVDSGTQIVAATGFYVRNRLSRSGTNGMSGFNPSYPRDGRGITRHHINYIPQFSAWLQNVRITNLDYREVLAEPGENVMCVLDPPYAHVGKTMYPFGDADLAELAQRVRTSPHSCLVTVDDTSTNRVLFSDMSPIVRSYASTMGDHHAASELICANYTTPLYAIHARDIGVMLELAPVASPTECPTGISPATPVLANDNKPASLPLPGRKVNREEQVRNMFYNEHGQQKTCEWYTPDWLLKLFYAANDNQPFDLDPCSPLKGADAPVWARQHFTIEDDGLARDWHGCVWMNPPFHSLKHWVRKAADAVWCRHMPNAPTPESAKRERPLCETVVSIFPARTHTAFWRKYVSEHARVFFIAEKISFMKGVDGTGQPVKSKFPEGLAVVIWGNHTRFTEHLHTIPTPVIDLYERSAQNTPDHPVRYWDAIKKEVA